MPDVGSQAFLDAAQSKHIVTYLDLVAAAVLVYDIALNIGDEAQYIWFSPLSLGKALYLLTRYPVIVDTTLVLYHQFAVLTPGECDVIYKTIGYLLGVGTLIAESILVMRTWVIWNRSAYMGATLISGLVLAWVPVFYFLAQSLNSLVFADPPAPHIAGCYLHSQKNILFAVFLIITGFESIILILTLIRFAPNWRRKKTALISIIYRDGIFNYVYLCILSVCNVVVLLTAPRGYTTLLSALQRVMHSILSSRVLLNLRQAVAAPALVDTSDSYNTRQEVLFQPWATVFAPSSTVGDVETTGVALRDIRISQAQRGRVQSRERFADDDQDDDEEDEMGMGIGRGTERRMYPSTSSGKTVVV